MTTINTLRPGLLVSLKTSVKGNVLYSKRDIEADHAVEGGARIAKWETERTVLDAAEHEAAIKVRGEASYLVARICAKTDFGLLCPEEKAEALAAAMAEARAKVDAFNATARITRVALRVVRGRVAPDDVEAIRAIGEEVAELIGTMSAGIESLDVEKIRDAAKRAREVSTMLTDGGRAKVADAIESARKAATAITKAVKAGEVAAAAVDAGTLEKLTAARTSFLDLDAPKDVETIADGSARAIELEPSDVHGEGFGLTAAPAIDLEV